MNRTASEGAALAGELRALTAAAPRARIALCPPFTALAAVNAALAGTPLLLGGQNLHAEAAGAWTGEISGSMLAAAGCRFVIVGHSERRHGLGEDDALVARKLKAAQRDGLTPIVCVGETLLEREGDRTAEVLVRQVRACYEGLDADAARATVIAYEPVWAIGTGKVASPAEAADSHRLIRATLDRVVRPGLGAEIAILYGGSVNPGNAASLFASDEIDGALVGGASLEAASFWRIVAAAG
ncbi:MAG: triose-phosphate isomerase [Candidatus Eisenbacteria bacterium]|nr:triose-phosphate isomerase [Candidatus Eisenbacteria bacterium]